MRTIYVLLISAGLVVVLESTFFALRLMVRRRSLEVAARLRALAAADAAYQGLLRRGRLSNSPGLAAVLRRIPLALRTERLLESADSELTVARLWGYSGLGAGAALVLGVALHLLLPIAVVLVVVGVLVPTALVWAAAARRSRKLSEQLPEALDMMSRSLRAGHAISAAFQMVATEMPSPVNLEFGRAFEEQRLGRSLDSAILHMTERSPNNRDIKIFAVSAVIQRETGGNFSEILQGIAETIRARYRFEGKLRAITAEGRASGFILSVLPIVFAALLLLVNPGYLTPLFADRSGHYIILYALLTWAAGVLWLYRLTKVAL
jgi:tight adherence protein B